MTYGTVFCISGSFCLNGQFCNVWRVAGRSCLRPPMSPCFSVPGSTLSAPELPEGFCSKWASFFPVAGCVRTEWVKSVWTWNSLRFFWSTSHCCAVGTVSGEARQAALPELVQVSYTVPVLVGCLSSRRCQRG